MNKYELTVILDGKISSAKKKKVQESLGKIVETFKGSVTKIEDWGVKELNYKIKKSSSGSYLFLSLELESSAAKGLLAKLRAESEILRYLLIKEEK
ncbi:30S ribosomal protein S6 [Candidatus Woesebacteria bacterium]|nr:30S ribosomal protein S6 [Candidatus Woesebacteria bacterium]